jgi:hypothetical protein
MWQRIYTTGLPLKSGRLAFLFTVDELSEGVDVPEVNMVLFLRPTQSLTVFLQQLGRGLRHAPEKECLTVLDFVGQVHRKYRMDIRLKALLPRHRHSIDKEVENNFPHLPAGCAIQFDKMSRKYVLDNIRANLQKMAAQVPERLQTFTSESGQELTFGNFVQYHDYEPERLLVSDSWTGWKASAQLAPVPSDPDLAPPPCMRIILSAGPCCTGNPSPTLPWTHPQDRTWCITPPGDTPSWCLPGTGKNTITAQCRFNF